MITLTLELRVTYEPNGVPERDLRMMLEAIADYAANNGMMTEDSAAEVEGWGYHVKSSTPLGV